MQGLIESNKSKLEWIKMKKFLFVFVLAVVLNTLLVGCSPKVVGNVLVTVKGKIAGGTYLLDQAAFDKNSTEETYNDPWMGNGLVCKGIMLKDLIVMVKASTDAKTISLITSIGKVIDIPKDLGTRYDIMLARWEGGVLLDERNGGPVKIVYPQDAIASRDPTFTNENWAWWIVSIEFK